MNRREFTASLAAIGLMPRFPLAAPAVAVAPPTIPAGTYAWAHLIARAQTKCNPAMLARQLHLSPEAARHLFNTMVSDGVLKAPGVVGVAKAANPINATGTHQGIAARLRSDIHRVLDADQTKPDAQTQSATPPLANDDEPCLGCDDTQTEDPTDASTDQSLQESSERR